MPFYLVERNFEDPWVIPPGSGGQRILCALIICNSDRSVTWIHSYIDAERRKSFCIYQAPSPEAIRRTARSNGLPVDRITEISVLSPHAYHLT